MHLEAFSKALYQCMVERHYAAIWPALAWDGYLQITKILVHSIQNGKPNSSPLTLVHQIKIITDADLTIPVLHDA
jgi:hypothetical protein